jgi:Protein of unknown function (DUF1292)
VTNGEVGDSPHEVTLLDESGAERRFLLHDAFDADGRTYYLVEAADDPEQVLLLKETEEGLESVDGEEFERVLTLLEAEEPEGGRS